MIYETPEDIPAEAERAALDAYGAGWRMREILRAAAPHLFKDYEEKLEEVMNDLGRILDAYELEGKEDLDIEDLDYVLDHINCKYKREAGE